MDVRFGNGNNAQIVLGGKVKVNLNVTARINDNGRAFLLTPDHVAGLRKPFVVYTFKVHNTSFFSPHYTPSPYASSRGRGYSVGMTAAPAITDRDRDKTKIINRLRRLEGQIRGLQKMVDEEKTCVEVMTQLASVKSALDATGDVILETYVEMCLARSDEPKDLVKLLKLAR